MGVSTWFKSIFGSKKNQHRVKTMEPIPILRTETPEKIIETKIKPVKIPTIMDIGERLALIYRDLGHLKNEMVSRSWFKSEYEDTGTAIIEKLSTIESKLNILINSLSNFTKQITKTDLTKIDYSQIKLSISDRLVKIIKEKKKIRYKNIATIMNVTDPTLCKYLKILLKSKKIKKIKEGKAVYYTLF